MEDRILQLEKQCRTLSAQVQNTKKKLNTVIDQQKQEVGELLLKLQKIKQSVSSTKEWMTQKVVFTLESLYLLGNGIHGVLLDLVTKMTKIPEEMGALALVESDVGALALVQSDKSVVKVKLLLERTQTQWEEMIRVLEAQLPSTQEVERHDSVSPATHHDEQVPPCSPRASDVIEVAPTVPTLAPASDAADKQLAVTRDEVAPAAPTTPLTCPTAPSTDGVAGQSNMPTAVTGTDSPLTICPSHPASPIGGDEGNMSTGRKRKADEEVDMDITRKKPASNRKKGPPSLPQQKQPSRGRSKVPDGDPMTPGQSSKADAVMDIE